jgi:hypothetical protein
MSSLNPQVETFQVNTAKSREQNLSPGLHVNEVPGNVHLRAQSHASPAVSNFNQIASFSNDGMGKFSVRQAPPYCHPIF